MTIFSGSPVTSIRLPVGAEIISINKVNNAWEIKYESSMKCDHHCIEAQPGSMNFKCMDCGKFPITPFKRECQHESDTYSYIKQHTPREHSKKCKKCGEFYR